MKQPTIDFGWQSFKLVFPTGRDSASFWDNATEGPSLSWDKGTMGPAQNLAKGWDGTRF